MFTPSGNEAVAHLLTALAERWHHSSETSLLHWWRVRVALLGLEHPEVYDTAAREALWPHLLTLGLPETFLREALVYAPPAEVLFGLPSSYHHLPGETLQEMHERMRPYQEKQGGETSSLEPAG